MKIALDAAGGDEGLKPNLEGAVRAARDLGVELLLVGPETAIREGLSALGVAVNDKRFEILATDVAIGMGEEPVLACREKPDASILKAAQAVAEGKADGLVSAGPTGASMVAALWHLKRLPGVLRPAIAVPLPTLKGTTVLLDAGANTDCKPWHLLQFAMMGTIYAKKVLNIETPKVGVLSIGEEDTKGNDLVKESIPLLKHSGLAFIGPIEGNDLPGGKADVVVCDGFVGNVALKVSEGMASAIFELLKGAVEKNLLYRAGAALMKGAFGDLKKRMSYDEQGGAPLLGVGGVAVVCHGRSNAKAIFNAIRVAKVLSESKANEEIKDKLEKMKADMEFAKVLQ